MWKFLLSLALVCAVQGASVGKNDEILDTVRRLLLQLKRDTFHYDSPVHTGEGTFTPIVTVVGGSGKPRPSSETGSEGGMGGAPGTGSSEGGESDVAAQAIDWLEGAYPEMFNMYAESVEDVSMLSDVMSAIMTNFLGAEREDLASCLQIAQLVGAIQFSIMHELAPGRHATIRQTIEHAMMKTGHVIPLDEGNTRRINGAIFEPLIQALHQLECSTGMFECPSANSIAMSTEYSSKSEELFWDIHNYLKECNMEQMSLGEILGNMVAVGHEWFQRSITTDISMVTCDESIMQSAPIHIKNAIDQVLPALEFAPLQSRIEAELHSLQSQAPVSGDVTELARLITAELLKDHYVDKSLALQMLQDVLANAEMMGDIDHAVVSMSGHVLTFMYEMARDEGLYYLVDKDLHAEISAALLQGPVTALSMGDTEHIMSVTLHSVVQHWRTPCLNARLIGMLAGATEVYRNEAMFDPRLQQVLASIARSVGVSILDPNFKMAVDEIIQMTITESFMPLAEIIHRAIGRQPTEVSFIELLMRLSPSQLSGASGSDYVHAILDTLVPLLGHYHAEESDFICQVDHDKLAQIVREAYSLHSSIEDSRRKTALYNLVRAKLSANFAGVPQEAIGAITTMAVDTLNDVVLKDALMTLQRLEDVADENIVPVMIDFLAHEYAIFVHGVMERVGGRPAVPGVLPSQSPYQPPMHPSPIIPPVFGGAGQSPTLSYMAWQQALVNDFVMRYMNGMMRYTSQNVADSVTSNPCVHLPDMCTTLSSRLDDVMQQYGGIFKRHMSEGK